MSRPSPFAVPGAGDGQTPPERIVRLELGSEGAFVDPHSSAGLDADHGPAEDGTDTTAASGGTFARARRIAADHVNAETARRAQQISGNAGQIGTRGKARLTRGGERATAHAKLWLDAADHTPAEGNSEPKTSVKAGRWFTVGVGGFIAFSAGMTQPETVAIDALAALVTCWRYGGPWGEAKLAELRRKNSTPAALTAGHDATTDSSFAASDGDLNSPTDGTGSTGLNGGELFIIENTPDGPTATVAPAAPMSNSAPPQDFTPDPTPATTIAIAELANDITSAFAHQTVGLAGTRVLDINRSPQLWVSHLELPPGRTARHIVDSLDELESVMNVRPGSMMARRDVDLARQAYLTRVINDPLANMTKPTHPPFGSMTITKPYRLSGSRFEDGNPVELDLLGKHVGLIGMNGSGKSNLLNALLECLSASPDVVWWPIDLQQSASLRAWEPCAGRPVATNAKTAHRYLQDALAISQRRGKLLGNNALDYVLADDEDVEGIELEPDWVPSPKEPALVIVVDEFSLLAASATKTLRILYYLIKLLDTGRKSRVTLILANQRFDKDTAGSAAIRTGLPLKLLLRCAPNDVEMFLGKGSRAKGWLADRFALPSLFFVEGGPHQVPLRARVPKQDMRSIRLAVRDYMGPRKNMQLDAASVAGMDEALREEEWSEALAAVVMDFLKRDVDRVITEDLVAAMTKRDAKWAEADPSIVTLIRDELDVNNNSLRGVEGRPRGFLLNQIMAALEKRAAEAAAQAEMNTADDDEDAEDEYEDDLFEDDDEGDDQ